MDTRSAQPANDQLVQGWVPPSLAADADFHHVLPSRPAWHKPDCDSLIQLVIRYRDSWEIYLTVNGTWTAQGVTHANGWARFESDSAEHLEQMIISV